MTSPITGSSLVFPHPLLTPIVGTPTNSSVKLLRKEMYANALAIASNHGGGAHGHLGLAMPAAAYLALATVAFTLPAHPGPAPLHLATATAAQIAETIRLYNATLAEIATANNVRGELKKQLLAAVNPLYLGALEDSDFGFGNVSIPDLLAHLEDTYSILTWAELEANRSSIASAWTPEEPIEHLWARLREIQRVALVGNEAISDTAIMELTFFLFEKTGVFTNACDAWRVQPAALKTMANFIAHFCTENLERLRKLTAAQAGFHGAHAATTPRDSTPTRRTPPSIAVTPPDRYATAGGIKLYYCWTHGLGTNAAHTGVTCQNKASGHQDDATVLNMQGGNNAILAARQRRRTTTTPSSRDT